MLKTTIVAVVLATSAAAEQPVPALEVPSGQAARCLHPGGCVMLTAEGLAEVLRRTQRDARGCGKGLTL